MHYISKLMYICCIKIKQMKSQKINSENFMKNTMAKFTPCEKPETFDFNSHGSSFYKITENGIIRTSNHWGDVASCIWTIDGVSLKFRECTTFCVWLTGFCSFDNFENYTEKFNALRNQIVERRNLNQKFDDILEQMKELLF